MSTNPAGAGHLSTSRQDVDPVSDPLFQYYLSEDITSHLIDEVIRLDTAGSFAGINTNYYIDHYAARQRVVLPKREKSEKNLIEIVRSLERRTRAIEDMPQSIQRMSPSEFAAILRDLDGIVAAHRDTIERRSHIAWAHSDHETLLRLLKHRLWLYIQRPALRFAAVLARLGLRSWAWTFCRTATLHALAA